MQHITLPADQLFILVIMTVNTFVWLILSISSVRRKLPTIYLITRSWWWMLALLFTSYWVSQQQNNTGSYPYWWVLDALFVFIALRGLYEIARLRGIFSKSKLLKKLSAQAGIAEVKVKIPLPRFGRLDALLVIALLALAASLITLHHLSLARGAHGIVLLVLFASQFNDIAQYLCGRLLGGRLFKRKLAPTLSPNKTIEGALFGTLLSALLATAFGVWLTPFETIVCFGLAYLLAFSGVVGDLLESAFKRRHGVKDVGTMLAGHGGILDRVDSLLLGVPLFTVIYWLIL